MWQPSVDCRVIFSGAVIVYLSCEHLNPRWRPNGESSTADDPRQFLLHLAAGYREEFELAPAQFEVMPDLLRLRESFLYSLMKPAPERFDDSVPIQRGSHAAMLEGIEKRWENGLPDYGIDFSEQPLRIGINKITAVRSEARGPCGFCRLKSNEIM